MSPNRLYFIFNLAMKLNFILKFENFHFDLKFCSIRVFRSNYKKPNVVREWVFQRYAFKKIQMRNLSRFVVGFLDSCSIVRKGQ